MSVFFLLVGLEIKREMLEGELSNIKNASLPIFAAIGGMLVPALIYAFLTTELNMQKDGEFQWQQILPFLLAIISMLSSRVPASIKIFLAALAIVDDLGAILVIAIFYTEQLHWSYLLISGGILVLLVLFNKLGVKNIFSI